MVECHESLARLGATSTTEGPSSGRLATCRIGDDYTVRVLGLASPLEPESIDRDRIVNVDDALETILDVGDAEDVGLVVAQPLVDPYLDYSGADAGPFPLAMSAADLEILAQLSDTTPVTLLHFAASAARARSTGGVSRFSTLDEYALYRELGDTHAVGPPDKPVQLLAVPGTALPFRLAVARDLATTSVLAPGAAGVVEVTRRFRGVDVHEKSLTRLETCSLRTDI